ncbi:MAG: hypothetical protein MZU97_20685 [Bacillus subtilis]|nr:hypothetical protein [Bacillus subtilis]
MIDRADRPLAASVPSATSHGRQRHHDRGLSEHAALPGRLKKAFLDDGRRPVRLLHPGHDHRRPRRSLHANPHPTEAEAITECARRAISAAAPGIKHDRPSRAARGEGRRWLMVDRPLPVDLKAEALDLLARRTRAQSSPAAPT